MARPRRGKQRQRDTNWLTEYLITGIEPDLNAIDADPFDVLVTCSTDSEGLRTAWEQSNIMARWNRPGLRPFGWWVFEAPRLPLGTFPNCLCDGELPQPRRYRSGAGQPLHEALSFEPHSHFGIWNWCGDRSAPPTFESQYEYLQRHGLLLDGEDEPLPETAKEPDWILEWPQR